MTTHDYEPLGWEKSLGYKVDETGKRCRASVPNGGRSVGFHQCGKRPVDGGRYCATHTPEAVEARRTASDQRYAAKQAAEKLRNMRWHGAPFIAALRQIASGHNDPRALAAEVLGEHGFEVTP